MWYVTDLDVKKNQKILYLMEKQANKQNEDVILLIVLISFLPEKSTAFKVIYLLFSDFFPFFHLSSVLMLQYLVYLVTYTLWC